VLAGKVEIDCVNGKRFSDSRIDSRKEKLLKSRAPLQDSYLGVFRCLLSLLSAGNMALLKVNSGL
jgi:hypothetical protein